MAEQRTPPLNLGEQLLEEFLTTGCTTDPLDVAAIAQRYTQTTGIGTGTVYLADILRMGGGPDPAIEGMTTGRASCPSGRMKDAEQGTRGPW
ncbi:hypothetical protein ACIA8O_25115 [Kitasatospora sp. NPDC051853]|uniref:hypothetical protein n=1 Tax=Kitasatospora sp. NPDC051853 TaxID=3364058 RepID=UPI0037BB8FDA